MAAATRSYPTHPYCECGWCDATGRNGGEPVLLPISAWEIAGDGDLQRLAVAPGHEQWYREAGGFVFEDRGGWIAVALEKP